MKYCTGKDRLYICMHCNLRHRVHIVGLVAFTRILVPAHPHILPLFVDNRRGLDRTILIRFLWSRFCTTRKVCWFGCCSMRRQINVLLIKKVLYYSLSLHNGIQRFISLGCNTHSSTCKHDFTFLTCTTRNNHTACIVAHYCFTF